MLDLKEDFYYKPITFFLCDQISRFKNTQEITYLIGAREWLDCNHEFDILLLFITPNSKEKRLVSVEVKRDANVNVLFHQALVRQIFADYIYLAFPIELLSYYWKYTIEAHAHWLHFKPLPYGYITFNTNANNLYLLAEAKKNNSFIDMRYRKKMIDLIIEQGKEY